MSGEGPREDARLSARRTSVFRGCEFAGGSALGGGNVGSEGCVFNTTSGSMDPVEAVQFL